MTGLTPGERAEWRRAAALGPSHGVNINSRILLALLDAADERDRLAAAIERIEHDARCPHPKCPGHGMCCCPEAKP